MIAIRRIDADEATRRIGELADVLADCVAGGASVGFMHPFPVADAQRWWEGAIDALRRGGRALFVALDETGVVGTGQLNLETMPNQAHRGDVMKMLVHRRGRRRGVAAALLAAIEEEARARGLTLLTLDTCQGSDAERLYRRTGYVAAGVIPHYALNPDGGRCDAVLFWKAL